MNETFGCVLDGKFTHLHHHRDRHQSLTLVLRLTHVVIQFGVKTVDLYLQQKIIKKLFPGEIVDIIASPRNAITPTNSVSVRTNSRV